MDPALLHVVLHMFFLAARNVFLVSVGYHLLVAAFCPWWGVDPAFCLRMVTLSGFGAACSAAMLT